MDGSLCRVEVSVDRGTGIGPLLPLVLAQCQDLPKAPGGVSRSRTEPRLAPRCSEPNGDGLFPWLLWNRECRGVGPPAAENCPHRGPSGRCMAAGLPSISLEHFVVAQFPRQPCDCPFWIVPCDGTSGGGGRLNVEFLCLLCLQTCPEGSECAPRPRLHAVFLSRGRSRALWVLEPVDAFAF